MRDPQVRSLVLQVAKQDKPLATALKSQIGKNKYFAKNRNSSSPAMFDVLVTMFEVVLALQLSNIWPGQNLDRELLVLLAWVPMSVPGLRV